MGCDFRLANDGVRPRPGGGAAAHHRNGVHLGGKDRWSACVRWNFKIYMALPEHSSLIAEE